MFPLCAVRVLRRLGERVLQKLTCTWSGCPPRSRNENRVRPRAPPAAAPQPRADPTRGAAAKRGPRRPKKPPSSCWTTSPSWPTRFQPWPSSNRAQVLFISTSWRKIAGRFIWVVDLPPPHSKLRPESPPERRPRSRSKHSAAFVVWKEQKIELPERILPSPKKAEPKKTVTIDESVAKMMQEAAMENSGNSVAYEGGAKICQSRTVAQNGLNSNLFHAIVILSGRDCLKKFSSHKN